ncbi:MAG: hypothetical protein AB7O57_08920 [Hyphomicrobiaceae bacterium]
MSKLSWLFASRQASPRRLDGGTVLDRIEKRLGVTLRGETRLVLASELDRAVVSMAEQQSISAAVLAARREVARITSLLPPQAAAAIAGVLADELVQSHGQSSAA